MLCFKVFVCLVVMLFIGFYCWDYCVMVCLVTIVRFEDALSMFYVGSLVLCFALFSE